MDNQVTIFDLMARVEHPPLWDCMETCVHAGGPWDDHFPGRPDKKRCRYPDHVGITNGKWMKSKTVNNIWHCWCTLYEYDIMREAHHD